MKHERTFVLIKLAKNKSNQLASYYINGWQTEAKQGRITT